MVITVRLKECLNIGFNTPVKTVSAGLKPFKRLKPKICSFLMGKCLMNPIKMIFNLSSIVLYNLFLLELKIIYLAIPYRINLSWSGLAQSNYWSLISQWAKFFLHLWPISETYHTYSLQSIGITSLVTPALLRAKEEGFILTLQQFYKVDSKRCTWNYLGKIML